MSRLHVGLILFIFFFVLRTLGLSPKIISVLAFPCLCVEFVLPFRVMVQILAQAFQVDVEEEVASVV